MNLTALVARVKYKPGWKFEVWNDPSSFGYMIRISMQAPHRDTGEIVPIHGTCYIGEYLKDEKQAVQILRCAIHDLECHEADEMILLDGKRIFDPHRGDKVTLKA